MLTSASKEHIICHYLHFSDKGFKFEPIVWNGCHDLLMMFMNVNDIYNFYIHAVDYHCINNRISKIWFNQKSGL